jgi:hypothetical protein
MVERRLYRLLHAPSERLHPLELERTARLAAELGHEPSRFDHVRLRDRDALKRIAQIALGILLAIGVLFVLTIVVHQLRAH